MGGLDANNSATAMTFSVAEGDDRTVTVTASGELDITNVEALGSAVAPALEHDPVRLIVDAREPTFADSSAIALWVGRLPCPKSSPVTRHRSYAGSLTQWA